MYASSSNDLNKAVDTIRSLNEEFSEFVTRFNKFTLDLKNGHCLQEVTN